MIPVGSTDDPSWLVRARREIGTLEIAGARHNPRILRYHLATRLRARSDETAWCAAFVCWCLEEEGVVSTRSAAARSYRDYGRPSELVPGAIVYFLPTDPDAGGTGHVAFVDRVDEMLGIVWVVGGNQRNAVSSAARRIADVAACRWPTFA